MKLFNLVPDDLMSNLRLLKLCVLLSLFYTIAHSYGILVIEWLQILKFRKQIGGCGHYG